MIFVNPVQGEIHPASETTPIGVFHVSQPFGCTGFPAEPPLGSCAHFHRGLDIGNRQCGAPILAAAGGKVWRSAVLANGDNYIWLSHGSGWFTLYGHLQDRLVLTGGIVTAGKQIGHMGDTGMATACHLHFAVKSGADIDGNLFSDTNGHWEDPWTHLSQNGADMAQKPITDTTPKLIDWPDGTPYFDVDGTTKLGTANATSNRYSPHGCGTQRAFYAGTPPTAKLALVTPSAVHPIPAPPVPVALSPGVYKVG